MALFGATLFESIFYSTSMHVSQNIVEGLNQKVKQHYSSEIALFEFELFEDPM